MQPSRLRDRRPDFSRDTPGPGGTTQGVETTKTPSATFLATWLRPGEVAVRAALARYADQRCPLSALEYGLATAEADPDLIAIGRGSVPNSEGVLELDASIMRGSDLKAGAVCSVRDILPVISLARKVMEETPHIMLAGDEARRFAVAHGFKAQDLSTSLMNRLVEKYHENPDRARQYVHSTEDLREFLLKELPDPEPEPAHDTITMLAREDNRFFAASSTSGMPFKLPGRVGDSPIIGAGIYADDDTGCAGATGLGEELWKAVASFRAVEHMRHGLSAQESCDAVIDHMVNRQPHSRNTICVVLALDKHGGYGAASTHNPFDLWIGDNGQMRSQRYEGRV